MLLRNIILLVTILAFSSSALASFERESCSDPAGDIRYTRSWSWNTPGNSKWVIGGKAISPVQVQKSNLEAPIVLESASNNVVSNDVYAQKVEIRVSFGSEDRVIRTWLLCKSARGI